MATSSKRPIASADVRPGANTARTFRLTPQGRSYLVHLAQCQSRPGEIDTDFRFEPDEQCEACGEWSDDLETAVLVYHSARTTLRVCGDCRARRPYGVRMASKA